MEHHHGYARLRPILPALLASLSTAILTAACVTINVYFPEAAVKDLSEKIETAVAREAAQEAAVETDQEGGGDGGGQASLDVSPTASGAMPMGSSFRRSAEIALGTVLHLLGPRDALAQGSVAAPEITNPAIRKIIESRGARVAEIDAYKARGVIGENNEALLEARDLASLPLQERAGVQKLVREENADRERMFKEIAAATGADLSTLPQIQATYAETLRQRARPGEWIQGADGRWRQKS